MRVVDLSVKDYEKLCHVVSSEKLDAFDKSIEMAVVLGVNYDNMTMKELHQSLNDLNPKKEELYHFSPWFTLNGYQYHYVNDLREDLILRLQKLLKNRVKSHPENFLSYALALAYERQDLTDNEHRSEAHILEKAKQFDKMPCGQFIKLFGEFLNRKIEEIDELKKEVEQQILDSENELGASIV